MKYIVDTNVPIVANGRTETAGGRTPSLSCRLSAVQFLAKLIERGRIVIDSDGEVRAEYHRHLDPRGEPGVGNRFYLEVLNSNPARIEVIKIPKKNDGEYVDCPAGLVATGFDPSDRKFVALAKRSGGTVANAVDSDWIEHADMLDQNGVVVSNLCGCVVDNWFEG